MAIRPQTVPRWAGQAPSGGVIQPPSGVANAGWTPNQRPPAPWLNQIQNANGAWIDFFRGANIAAWQYLPAAGSPGILPVGRGVAVDTVTAPYGSPPQAAWRYAIFGQNASTLAVNIYVSRTGDTWKPLGPTALTGMYANFFNGVSFVATSPGRWFAFGANGAGAAWFRTTVADDGSTSGINPYLGTSDAGLAWTDGVLPSGTSTVLAVDGNPAGSQFAALAVVSSANKILYSSDGITWTAATVTGTPTGTWVDVVWAGTNFVALTSTGQIWTSVSPAGTWTLAAGSSATGHAIAAGPPGTVILWDSSGPAAVSTNGGATWSTVTPATTFTAVVAVAFGDNGWVLRSASAPYLASSNDLVNWTPLPIPFTETVTSTQDNNPGLVYAGGRWIAPTQQSVLVSGHAQDLDPAPYAPSGAPAFLTSATALLGVPLDASVGAPANGDVLVYNATLDQWQAATVAPPDTAWTDVTDGSGTSANVAAGVVSLGIATSANPSTNGPFAKISILNGESWEFQARINTLSGDSSLAGFLEVLGHYGSYIQVVLNSDGSGELRTTLGGVSNFTTFAATTFSLTGTSWIRLRFQHGMLVMYYGTGTTGPVAPPVTWTRVGPIVTTTSQTEETYTFFDARLDRVSSSTAALLFLVDSVTFTTPGP